MLCQEGQTYAQTKMKTRKNFTTEDLFTKFNFRPTGDTGASKSVNADTSASSAPNSDVVERFAKEPLSTPPSSPPTPLDRQRALVEQGALSKLVPVREDSIASLANADDDKQLPAVADLIKASRATKADNMVATGGEQPGPKQGLKLACTLV